MIDLLTALALVLVIEGLLYAAFPEPMKRLMASVMTVPASTLRFAGLVAAAAGVACVALLRHGLF